MGNVKMKKIVPIGLIILAIIALLKISPYPKACAVSDYYPADDWRTSTPEEQGIDSEKLVQMLNYVKEEHVDIDSMLIIRHGYLVLESYVAPYHRDTIHNVKSVSKSILSALVGIALREKILTNIDQKVADFFPEYYPSNTDPRKKEITLHHLLTMTSGIDYEDESVTPSGKKENWIRSVKSIIDLPIRDDPGEKFRYSTAQTHIMSGILTQRSGMSTKEFAGKQLFEPLGIDNKLWRQDAQGIYMGGTDIFLTPRDMTKFGYLYLKKGFWNGKEIVPSEWVDASTRFQVKTGGDQGISDDYGYWWWVFPGGYAAVGFGGQMIIIVPDYDLVVVLTSADEIQSFKIWDNYIKPAVQTEKLDPNPKATNALSQLIHDVEYPKPQPVKPIPQNAKPFMGKKYKLETNALGFTAIQLNMVNDREYSVLVETLNSTFKLPVGLDGSYRVYNDPDSKATFGGGLPVACRGQWLASSSIPTFIFDWIDVGEPNRVKGEIIFADKQFKMSFTEKNYNQTITINGSM